MGTVKEVPLTEVKARLSSLVNDVAHAGTRVLILAHGKPKAELVQVQSRSGSGSGRAGGPDPVEEAAAFAARLARSRRKRPWAPSWRLLRDLRRGAD
jgi:prevent-host-death family protein